MTSNELYVWVYLPNSDQPIVAGKHAISHLASGDLGTFIYARSYLQHKDSFTIDPAKLPLTERSQQFNSLHCTPSALLDSCPDNWGMRVIERLSGQQEFPSGYLLMNDPGRVGALAFSKSNDVAPQELRSREFSLEELLHATELIEADKPVDEELLKALLPGTGGARPKCNILHEDALWIAKFPSSKDPDSISIPRLEHATMSLAKLCGVNAAETKIIKVANKDICLVKRFDRTAHPSGFARKHYISGRTLFSADPNYIGTGSYQRLARWLPRYVDNMEYESIQLFRRMVFNVAVRNSDDHELNHGLLHKYGNQYQLSPAFDVLPTLGSTNISRHALLIGESADGTIENLLSIAKDFKLQPNEAMNIINDIENTIKLHFDSVFYEAGFGDEEIRRIDRYFSPIPRNSDSRKVNRP